MKKKENWKANRIKKKILLIPLMFFVCLLDRRLRVYTGWGPGGQQRDGMKL